MKILFPIDMTNPVAGIIDQVASVLPLSDRSVHLLYVNETWPAYENVLGMAGQFADDWHRIVADHAEKTLDEAAIILEGKCQKVTSEIVTGPPALMIETVARDEHFDLTVLVPGKHPLYETILVGSVSSNVVKHGPGTLLIVHPGAKYSEEMHNVLIGVDGSSNAREALLKAVEVFQLNKRNVNVLLLHVIDISDPIRCVSPVEFLSRLEQNLILQGEALLAESKRLLADAGVKKVEMALKHGKPVHELIETARAMPADLIVTGAEGHSVVQHFFLGSVSHRMSMHSPCPVAIIKHTADRN